MAASTEGEDHIEGGIAAEILETIYPDRIPEEMDFPPGTALLVALTKLHRETDDADLIEHIEREIKSVRDGHNRLASFKLKPFPYAGDTHLLKHADHFENRDDPVSRYFRLRAFESVGAFDDRGLRRVRQSEGPPMEGLTDEERAFVEGL
ncbi:hypothetical protein [Halobaculum rubrum]|uniref:hypothetical protein n=1 Tax=Halobaculum rubrum TaxID=2872158 RepID=UPI001CA4392A|nr:hypothetical protein [Halobaculum rubrum]QZX99383.1 hypothetical protein K6T25_14205 [Halobaculum rubrum]